MRYSIVFTAMAATTVSGHGLIRSIEGANGVTMPGLTGKTPDSSNYTPADTLIT